MNVQRKIRERAKYVLFPMGSEFKIKTFATTWIVVANYM